MIEWTCTLIVVIPTLFDKLSLKCVTPWFRSLCSPHCSFIHVSPSQFTLSYVCVCSVEITCIVLFNLVPLWCWLPHHVFNCACYAHITLCNMCMDKLRCWVHGWVAISPLAIEFGEQHYCNQSLIHGERTWFGAQGEGGMVWKWETLCLCVRFHMRGRVASAEKRTP